MNYSLNSLYKTAGISKQAVCQYDKEREEYLEKLAILTIEVDILREDHPGCGLEKIYKTLRPDFIGRDNFISTFMELGYRVKKNKNYIRTTIPAHFRYPNLIEGSLVWKENQIWQSDITYFLVEGTFYYLTFIVDVYTRKIVGYEVSNHLRADANLNALKMALRLTKGDLEGLIHHSDRGSQYVDKRYTGLLKCKGIKVSMGLKAQDNSYAERVNGIIKNEYLKYKNITTFEQLKKETKKAVTHYNNKRIHKSIFDCTPNEFELGLLKNNLPKKPKMIIYSEGNKIAKATYGHLSYSKEELLYMSCPLNNN